MNASDDKDASKKRKVKKGNNANNSNTPKKSMRSKLKITNNLKGAIAKSAILASSVSNASSFTTSPYFSSSTPASSSIKAISTSSITLSSSSSSDNSQPDISDATTKTKRTKSFNPKWSNDITIPIHTLVLGTHPSIESLSKQQYFGHPMNAFWWIAGDCLNFRRDDGISKTSNKPYKFTEHLNFDNVIPYEDQMNVFTSKGFALWDIVQSCEREGSLDSNIQQETPNNIREFCNVHGTVKRIVIANGLGGCKLFLKHFRSWWEDKDDKDEYFLMPGRNDESLRAFPKYKDRTNGKIEVISALAVSPAAAKYSYLEKRDFWEKYCYAPGLKDYQRLKTK